LNEVVETPILENTPILDIPMDASLNEVVENLDIVTTPILDIPMDASLNEIVETLDIVTTPILENSKILETPLEKTIQVLGFRVSVISLQLGLSARFGIFLNCLHGENSFIDYKEIVIEGEEYSNWGNDDQYIMDLVSQKLLSLI
jgi:hypothetical protein